MHIRWMLQMYAILFLDEEALKIKNKQDLDESWLKEQFADESILVFKDAAQLKEKINLETKENCVILLMSSGNFAGMSLI
jgi:UDP-N-acetylmuramate: L-alanyl-gamma-D-glutamyl-meso-diaminopimelate ligase